MFETYKLMDEINMKREEMHGKIEQVDKILTKNKYFPEDDD